MVQAFPTYRSNDALNVSSVPGRPWSTEDLFDTQDLDFFAKFISVDPISIPKKVFGCAVEWEGFDHLLRRPCSRRVSGNVVVKNASALMGKHNEDEQDFNQIVCTVKKSIETS